MIVLNRLRRNAVRILKFLMAARQERKMAKTLHDWYREERSLPMYYPVPDKVLVVYLEDTADYLLWRNSLPVYKFSPVWNSHHITLLGNEDWKGFFEYADSSCVDEVIWINRTDYFAEPSYRRKLWEKLLCEGFRVVICPSHTRIPLLEDVCAIATGSEQMFTSASTYFKHQSNKVSDAFYQYIYQPKYVKSDFLYNQDFANWCCHTEYTWEKPMIDGSLFRQPVESDYILCFISSSEKNSRLPAGTWIRLIKMMQAQYSSKIMLAGEPADNAMADQIAKALPVESIVGIISQTEIINHFAFANAIIASDMAAIHLAICCQTPVLALSNGENFTQLTGYQEAELKNMATIYAKPFLAERKKRDKRSLPEVPYIAMTGDMDSMIASDILHAFECVYPAAIMRVISNN